VVQTLRRALALTAAALLVSCGSDNTDNAPKSAPTGFSVTAGDSSVVVTWDMEPGLTYWIFSAAAPSITRDNFNQFAGARITQPATSPQLITGLVNGTTYSFLINATKSGSAAGPATTSIAAVPRLAGNTWTAGTPLGADLNAIGFGVAKYIAVGAGGAIFTRGTGLADDWTAATSGVTAALNGVAAGGLLVVVGDGGTLITSSDAVTWTAQTSGTTARLNSVLFAQFAYVAVGDNGTILRSTDATTWTAVTSGTTANLYAIAVLGSRMLAAGANGTLLSSTDAGLTWTPVTSGTTNTLRGLAATSNLYVAVGDAGTILTSTDLAAWTAATSPTTQNLLRVTFGTQLVAVGTGGTALLSTDGLTWTAANTGTTADLRGLLHGATLNYYAVGAGGVVLEAR
jgi:hypothetical protein